MSLSVLKNAFEAGIFLSNFNLSSIDGNVTNLSTQLRSFQECTSTQKAQIYSRWQQSWKIMNLLYDEAVDGINFNEGAAIEYIAPPALKTSFNFCF